jgi:glycosyltransferase involved in cell wall biosynthesis
MHLSRTSAPCHDKAVDEKSDNHGRLTVVIPALDEAATIGAVVAACRALPFVSDIIVIDDGSADDTAGIAGRGGARVLRNPTNQGKGASLWRGMTEAVAAGASRVATLDADGQHRTDDLAPMLVGSLAWPGHIVIGSRRASGRDAPRARFIANRVADFWVSWAAGHPIDDSQSGFRVYPAALIRALAGRPPLARGFAFESEALIEAARLGFSTVAVDIPTIYGDALRRPSHFRPVADITRIVVMVAGKLFRRGMDPAGLWRSLTLPRLRAATPCRH